jgi:uncharacterized protein
MTTTPRFFRLPGSSFFLLGPRGTGKTTWLEELLPDALWIDLLSSDEYRLLEARPERLKDIVLSSAARDVVIDEVQRVPELLNVVHLLINMGERRRYVLTGSSARKLRRRGVNLLGGRALLETLHPFMAAEWPAFDLRTNLEIGMLPLVVTAEDPHAILAGYAALYLEQEVKAEGMVRNIGQFARFLEAISFSHGAVLNISNVARESGVSRSTVAGFVEIIEDLLLAFRVEVFTRRAKRETAAHPKFYVFDAGVFRSLRPRGPIDRPQEFDGSALEGLIAQHLRAWIAYSKNDFKLFTWRTKSNLEVDFILYGGDGFWAIEVQNSRDVRPADLRGLKAFAEDYPECRPLLLYRGDHRIQQRGVLCLPIEAFLQSLRPGSPLPVD